MMRMTTMAIGRYAVGFFALVGLASMQPAGATSPASSALSDADMIRNVSIQRSAFVEAEAEERWSEVRPAVWDLGSPTASTRDTLQRLYEEWIRGNHRAGAFVREEDVMAAAFHREGERILAVVDVTRRHELPFDPAVLVDSQRKVVAFSDNAGRTWKFNVSDCISNDIVKRFFPLYAGNPALRYSSEGASW